MPLDSVNPAKLDDEDRLVGAIVAKPGSEWTPEQQITVKYWLLGDVQRRRLMRSGERIFRGSTIHAEFALDRFVDGYGRKSFATSALTPEERYRVVVKAAAQRNVELPPAAIDRLVKVIDGSAGVVQRAVLLLLERVDTRPITSADIKEFLAERATVRPLDHACAAWNPPWAAPTPEAFLNVINLYFARFCQHERGGLPEIEPIAPIYEPECPPCEQDGADESYGVFESCLAELTEREILVLEATVLQGEDDRVVAERLGITPGNVRVIRCRALHKLKMCLASRGW